MKATALCRLVAEQIQSQFGKIEPHKLWNDYCEQTNQLDKTIHLINPQTLAAHFDGDAQKLLASCGITFDFNQYNWFTGCKNEEPLFFCGAIDAKVPNNPFDLTTLSRWLVTGGSDLRGFAYLFSIEPSYKEGIVFDDLRVLADYLPYIGNQPLGSDVMDKHNLLAMSMLNYQSMEKMLKRLLSRSNSGLQEQEDGSYVLRR